MKLVYSLFTFVLCVATSGNAQTPAELNAQLRQELLTVKAKSEEIKPVFEKMKLAYTAYCDTILMEFKAIPAMQFGDSRMKLSAYKDSMGCINPEANKKIPYDELLKPNRQLRAQENYHPCMQRVNEVLAVKNDITYRPHEVTLGQKSVDEENKDLEESIQGYSIKIEKMISFLDEAQTGFLERPGIESSIRSIKAEYESELVKLDKYNSALKDSVSNARKLYLANPETSKYKRCFYKEKPVSYPESPNKEPVIYMVTDEIPEFIGGREAMNKYLSENLVYPEFAKKKGIEGKVYVKFVISESGNVSNVKVQKGIPDCQECDAEAVRVVNDMPDWTPAKTNGKPVNSFYNLPVPFKIQ